MTLLASPTSAQSHGKIEFAPALGWYAPTGPTPDPNYYGCARIKGGPPCVILFPSIDQPPVLALGGRMTAWLSQRAGFEGSFWYAPSGVAATGGWGSGAYAGDIVSAVLRFAVRVPSGTQTRSLVLMAGPALSHRSGDYWAQWSGTTALGGAFGVGLEFRPPRGISFRAAIDDYAYHFGGDPSSPRAASAVHNDLVFSLSLGISSRAPADN